MIDVKFIAIALLYFCTTVRCLPLEENGKNIERNLSAFDAYRLPTDTVPIHYDIKLDVNFDTNDLILNGEVTIEFKVRNLTSNVVLHAKYLEINKSATNLRTETETIMPIEQNYNHETEMMHVRFNDPLEPGVYALNFQYNKSGDDRRFQGVYRSFYHTEDGNNVRLLVTHLQPIFARRVFPCWDEPALKATFNISVKHPSNYTALSNMPIRSQEQDEKDGRVWTHFETTPIMSTNILGLVVVNYPHISNADGTTRVWAKNDSLSDANYLLEVAENATAELTKYLNDTVRVPKTDHVAVPHYSSRATENWGLIVYQEWALLYNAEMNLFRTKMSNILTITHELSHQWFGNLVSPSWWKYFWMSEGMATYLKYYITDKIFKEWRLMDYVAVDVLQQSAFLADDLSTVVPMNKDFWTPDDILLKDITVIYHKSTAILRMLSHIVSEDVFRAGLIKYINENEYSSVTSDDLWKAMQEALDESNVSQKRLPLKEIMDTWIEQTGYPLVRVTRNYSTGVVTIRQEVSPTNRDRTPRKWWIPISYATKSNPDFSKTAPTVWLGPKDEEVTIENVDVDDWIIVNLQETGYYRVNYDAINWERIAKYLNSDDYAKVHFVNRAQILDDSFRLTTSNNLSPITFIKLTSYLSRETDAVPWKTAFNILSGMSVYLKHPVGDEILKPYVLGLMRNLIDRVGYDDLPEESTFEKFERTNILNWACKLGDRKCKEKATEKLIAHLEDPETNKISPDLQSWTYCMGMMIANQSTWNKLFDLKKDDLDYKTLQYLSCSEDPAIVENYLNLALSNSSEKLLEYPLDILANLNSDISSNTDVKLNFTIKNWDKIKNLTSSRDWFMSDLISRIDTRERFDKLKTFLAESKLYPQLGYRENAIAKIEGNAMKIRAWFDREDPRANENERTMSAVD